MKLPGLLIAAAVLCLAPAGASAQPSTTDLHVEYGWGERVRGGRWTPVTVRVADLKTRPAVLELHAPQGGVYAMRVRQHFTLGPTPTVFPLYAPLIQHGENPTIVVRDADTGRTLARHPEDPSNYGLYRNYGNPSERLVGISGAPTGWRFLEDHAHIAQIDIARRDPGLLPATPVGYDSLDLLILHRPNLLRLDVAQQRAILDWVRGGGNLLLWPGDDPVPSSGPLVENLPCSIGGTQEVPIPADRRASLGVPARTTGIRGYTLTPRGAAEPIDLFGTPGSTAYARQLGLGRVVVAPVDLTQLRLENHTPDGKTGWHPLLAGMSILADEQPKNQNQTYYGLDQDLQREANAVTAVQDHLGDIPGAGSFGFSYVAIALLAMMFVVGPVDWFVLKKLGRQPWTWVTTTGWIALVTLGALYIGHVFKSGELHYHTLRVTEQFGDATVGGRSVVCLYSPRTTDYHLDAPRPPPAPGEPVVADPDPEPPAGWWEPSTGANRYYGGSGVGMLTDIPFRQTADGNAPGEMVINVWQLRFLRSRSFGGSAGTPLLRANLTMTGAGQGQPQVTGTITNLTDRPLLDVRIETGRGLLIRPGKSDSPFIERIEPGASVEVGGVQSFFAPKPADQDAPQANYLYGYRNEALRTLPGRLWRVAADLDGPRSVRADNLLKRGGWACVYARVDNPAPPATLREADAATKQRHEQFVRAVVPLAGDAPPKDPDKPPAF